MAKLRTLGQIVDYMEGLLSPKGHAAPVSAPATETVVSRPDLGRFALRCVPAPAQGFALSGLLGAKHLVITDDGHGVAKALADRLAGLGVKATVATMADANTDALIDLCGLRDAATVDQAIALNRVAFQSAHVAAKSIQAAGGAYVTVQDTDGDFGMTGSERAWTGGLAGLAKTASQEWTGASVRAIDLARGGRSADALAEALYTELIAGGAELEVGLSASGERFTLQSFADAAAAGKPVFAAGDVVVASGGARGVTAATLIALAKATRCKLVLLGRTALADEPAAVRGVQGDAKLKGALLADARARGEAVKPADLGRMVARIEANREILATIAAVKAVGGDARYVAADVRHRAALAAALADVRAAWGPVRGLVHGAGVLADRFIADKTEDQFDFVFDTKIDGLRALFEVLAGDPLKGIAFFSSVAARCGNQGQCDYAMANEVLNKVAALERTRRGGDVVVKSMGWGPWEGGMVTPALKARFESLGVPLIPLDLGAKMLVDELVTAGQDQIELVLGGEPRAEALAAEGQAPALRVELLVNHQTASVLDSHRVKGVAVVPVALALEWMARAARATRPDLRFAACRDIKVLSGIPVKDFDGVGERLVLQARQLSNGSGAVIEVSLQNAAGRKHYSAMIDMVATPSASPKQPAKLEGLSAWKAPVYGDVLFHGPDFQMIRAVQGVSDAGISGDLVGAAGLGWTGAYTTDPALVDGGLQLALLWTQHALGGASLPTGVQRFQQWDGSVAGGTVRCVLRGRTVGRERAVSDIAFVTEAGVVIAELTGVDTHVLPGSAQA